MMIDFDTMMEMQRALQLKINGYDIEDQDDELRVQNIKLNVLALTAELHEALDETAWKPWATYLKSRPLVSEEPFRAELIDAFHFMMNLFLHAGMTAEDVWIGYARKHGINVTRQDEGYDATTSKCPQCQRALDDPASIMNVRSNTPAPHVVMYCVCGCEVGRRPLHPDEV